MSRSFLFFCCFYILYFYMILIVLWFFFFFSSRRRHTRSKRDWSSDVCSSDLVRGSSGGAGGGNDDERDHVGHELECHKNRNGRLQPSIRVQGDGKRDKRRQRDHAEDLLGHYHRSIRLIEGGYLLPRLRSRRQGHHGRAAEEQDDKSDSPRAARAPGPDQCASASTGCRRRMSVRPTATTSAACCNRSRSRGA